DRGSAAASPPSLAPARPPARVRPHGRPGTTPRPACRASRLRRDPPWRSAAVATLRAGGQGRQRRVAEDTPMADLPSYSTPRWVKLLGLMALVLVLLFVILHLTGTAPGGHTVPRVGS